MNTKWPQDTAEREWVTITNHIKDVGFLLFEQNKDSPKSCCCKQQHVDES